MKNIPRRPLGLREIFDIFSDQPDRLLLFRHTLNEPDLYI